MVCTALHCTALHSLNSLPPTERAHRSLLLKLPVDPELPNGGYMYGGERPDHARARKAAANELKACTRLYRTVFAWERSDVMVPIQMMIGQAAKHPVFCRTAPL
jgi:hypothetical protein